MRGLAVLCASGGVWILFGGSMTPVRLRRPSVAASAIVIGLASGFGVFAVALALLGSVVPSAAFGILGAGVPVQVRATREQKRRIAATSMWPDLLAHIRSSVAAGSTLPDAYLDAAERVAGPFLDTVDEVRRHLLFGEGFRSGMALVGSTFDDATADRVTMTLVVANETGGTRVGEVLAALSASVAGEARLRAAHDAALTEQRLTAAVALSAPWVILGLSIATNPQAAVAFRSTEGAVVVMIGLAMTVTGYLLARRLAALSDTPRMFRG